MRCLLLLVVVALFLVSASLATETERVNRQSETAGEYITPEFVEVSTTKREKKGIVGDVWNSLTNPIKQGFNKLKNGVKAAVSGAPVSGPKMSSELRRYHIEDCVCCAYVWQNVELEVGDDSMQDNIYDAFSRNCIEAEKTKIFYPCCETMWDQVWEMIGDYQQGMNVTDVCKRAGLGCVIPPPAPFTCGQCECPDGFSQIAGSEVESDELNCAEACCQPIPKPTCTEFWASTAACTLAMPTDQPYTPRVTNAQIPCEGMDCYLTCCHQLPPPPPYTCSRFYGDKGCSSGTKQRPGASSVKCQDGVDCHSKCCEIVPPPYTCASHTCPDGQVKLKGSETHCSSTDTRDCNNKCCARRTCKDFFAKSTCPPFPTKLTNPDAVCDSSCAEACCLTYSCNVFWKQKMCPSNSVKYNRNMRTKCNSERDCNKMCCDENVAYTFKSELHFTNGYSDYRLFNYHSTSKSSADGGWSAGNAGGFTNEHLNFPRAFNTLKAKLIALKDAGLNIDIDTKLTHLYLAGYCSILGDDTRNEQLSLDRVRSAACYVSQWLTNKGYRNWRLELGWFGRKAASGSSATAQANDRRVDIFLKENTLANMFQRFPSYGTSVITYSSNPLASSWCATKSNWQLPSFSESWLTTDG